MRHPAHILSRALLPLGLLLSLAGCAVPLASSNPADGRFNRAVLRQVGGGLLPPAPVDPRYLALQEAGAPVLRMQADEGAGVALRRDGPAADGVVRWRAPDGAAIDMRNGVVVASRGTADDLMFSDLAELQARLASGQPGLARRFENRMTTDRTLQLQTYVCTVTRAASPAGPVTREDCAGPDDGFINSYGPAGRSQQRVGGRMVTFSPEGSRP